MSDATQNKNEIKDNKNNEKEEKVKEKEQVQQNLKTTTEISKVFYLSKFSEKEIVHEEKLPKNFKELDHLLNKILLCLEETENVFMNQAKAIQCRDLALINWRFRLKHLHKTLREKKREFERMDQTVQCISKLNTHIERILVKLEKELPGTSLIDSAFKYSPIRMSVYESMLQLNISQRDMLQQVSTVVLSINEAIDRNPSDPVEQLTIILSLHMEVLRTIERRIRQSEEQLQVVKALQELYTNTKNHLICDYTY